LNARGYHHCCPNEEADLDINDSDYEEALAHFQSGRANVRYFALRRTEQEREDARKSKTSEVEMT